MRSFGAGLLAIFLLGALFARAPAPSVAGAGPRESCSSRSTASCAGPTWSGSRPTTALVRRLADALFRLAEAGRKTKRPPTVARDGGAPTQAADDGSENAPPANGRWDEARQRCSSTDGGDIVVYDGATGTRRWMTRTTAGEANAAGRATTPRHLRPRRQPLHRPRRGADVVDRHAAHRCRARAAEPAADRQPEVHPRRRGEADRVSRSRRKRRRGPRRRPRRTSCPRSSCRIDRAPPT